MVIRYPYGKIDSLDIQKHLERYRVDPRIYDYFFEEYQMKDPNFDHESFEKEMRMKEIEKESQERMKETDKN